MDAGGRLSKCIFHFSDRVAFQSNVSAVSISTGVLFMSKNRSHVVDLGIDPSIKTVAELRDRLITAIAQESEIVISGEAAKSVDVSVLQLLASAHRSAAAAGKPISLLAPAGGAIHQGLQKAGFLSPLGESLTREGSFWTSTAARDEAA
jgi:anti-anti-sigma regulatory factor